MHQHTTITSPIKLSSTGLHLPADATDHAAVLYPSSGLMVAVGAFDKPMTFAAAEKAVAKLTYAGITDWRLPAMTELVSLIDYERTAPAADPALFPDTRCAWYWSDTPCAWSPGRVWVVHFGLGGVHYDYRDDQAYVRPVRSVWSADLLALADEAEGVVAGVAK